MQFSIIVPVYNCGAYISQCLDSILDQNCGDYEVIVVDDGSTDESSAICEEYQKKDIRIKVHHKENGGVVSARKLGASLAKGEYIVTVDGDDYIDKKLLEILEECICRHQCDIVCYNAYSFSRDSKRELKNQIEKGLYSEEDLKKIKEHFLYTPTQSDMNYGTMLYALWSKAVRREIFVDSQMMIPDNISKGDDLAVIAPIVYSCRSVFVLSDFLYYYRENDSSIMHSFSDTEINKMLVLWEYLNGVVPTEYYINYKHFCLAMLNEYVGRLAVSCSSYKEFRKKTDEVMTRSEKFVFPAETHNYNFKTKAKIKSLQKRYLLVYLFYHIKKRRI